MARRWQWCSSALSSWPMRVHRRVLVPRDSFCARVCEQDALDGCEAHALSVSVGALGWRETSLRDCASIWSRVRLTEGRSGRERWVLSARDELSSEERSLVDIVVKSKSVPDLCFFATLMRERPRKPLQRRGVFDPHDAMRIKHTRIGVWDLYEEKHVDIPIPGASRLETASQMLRNLPYIWRMLKDICSVRRCLVLMLLYLAVEVAAALVPAVSLWSVALSTHVHLFTFLSGILDSFFNWYDPPLSVRSRCSTWYRLRLQSRNARSTRMFSSASPLVVSFAQSSSVSSNTPNTT